MAQAPSSFLGLPHTIVVNRAGRRFSNEAFYRAFYFVLEVIDGGPRRIRTFLAGRSSTARRERSTHLARSCRAELPAELGVKAASIGELAEKIGVDAGGLAATIAAFNGYCERGEDPEFNRGTFPWGALMCGDPLYKPNANLGTVTKGPFYAVELHRMAGGAIAAAGIVADQHCRALGWDNKPIEGLYVAGNSVARMETGAVMQSGITNARGMTHGYLAGAHAAGKPSDLLQKEIERLGI